METSRKVNKVPRFRLTVLVLTLALASGLFWVLRAARLNQALIDAVQNGDEAAVHRLLVSGVDANLNMPAAAVQTNMFDSLLEAARGKTHRTHRARSLLMQAVGSGKPVIVRDLLAHGADVRYSQDNGNTALLNSAARRRADCLELLIANHADIHLCNRAGQTPLHVAAQLGTIACVRVLLAHGADKSAKDKAGHTPLQVAYASQHTDVILLLLESGANYAEIERISPAPPVLAAQLGDVRLLQALWNRYLTPGDRVRLGPTALQDAISYDRLDATKFLFDQGLTLERLPLVPVYIARTTPAPSGSLSTSIPNPGSAKAAVQRPQTITIVRTVKMARLSPLIIAAHHSDSALFELLLAHGADVNAPDSSGWTPLIAAAQAGSSLGGMAYNSPDKWTEREREVEKIEVQMARALLARGANVNARDQNGSSALMFGVYSPNMVRLLLQNGADARVKNSSGMTPLMQAPNAEAARLLIAAGADVNAQDNRGTTALMNAALSRREDVVKCLLQNGADPNARDQNGSIVKQLSAPNTSRFYAGSLALIKTAGGK